MEIPFSHLGESGRVLVTCATTDEPAALGAHPDAAGLPHLTARVEYPDLGYRALFGWVQLVRSSDNVSAGLAFEPDPFELLGEAASPYCFFGVLPTLFDAPARGDRRRLDWLAHSYLAYSPLDSDGREVVPILGFSWGFDIHDEVLRTKPVALLDVDDWAADVPVLQDNYPAWTYAAPPSLAGVTDELLDTALVHGRQPGQVAIVEYDERWPARYAEHAARLREVLGERARRVEHIGSTSVPGLAAKPVVDIVVGIDDPDDEAAYLPDLQAAGYELRVREPEHRCLRGGEPEGPVNVHCYPPEHAEVHKYLVLRDQLRSDPSDRDRYEQVKRELAARSWPDVNYYADAKSPVINEILARAGWRG